MFIVLGLWVGANGCFVCGFSLYWFGCLFTACLWSVVGDCSLDTVVVVCVVDIVSMVWLVCWVCWLMLVLVAMA